MTTTQQPVRPIATPDLTPSPYADQRGHWKTRTVLVVGGRYRHGVGYVDSTGECRRTHEGEILPGPYAYGFGLATCIAANPVMSTGYQALQNRAAGTEFDVADGDVVRLGWDLFQVRVVRGQFLELDHVGSAL